MVVVAVAGGLGDLGRLITDALLEQKHDVCILSRKAPASPGEIPAPVLQTDYDETSLVALLEAKGVEVVVCTFIMDSDAVCEAQNRLIRASDKASCVRRLIPSEFNVEYEVGDDVLPYPEKKYHVASRRVLEKTTSLEYSYVYPGMLMDYFGSSTDLRPLYFFVDPAGGVAVLPDDGEARMSTTLTADVARFVALALDLDRWPRVMTVVASTVSLNELAQLVGEARGKPLDVTYQPVEKLLRRDGIDLPSNLALAREEQGRFYGKLGQLRALIADLEAGVALGAYDLTGIEGHVDLVKAFEGKTRPPRRIEEVVLEAWGSQGDNRVEG